MSNDGGGWTLVANIDDVNDPYFGGHGSPYFAAQWVAAWESASTWNETQIPTLTTDVSVSTKYRSFSEITVSDIRIAYKNSGAYFLGEGLDVSNTLDGHFSTIAPQGQCAANFGSISEDLFGPSNYMQPWGLNCNDPNEGWYDVAGHAENARIGALDPAIQCCVMSAWLGGMGDRGYSTSILEKTWGLYSTGVVTDNNIMLFVR